MPLCGLRKWNHISSVTVRYTNNYLYPSCKKLREYSSMQRLSDHLYIGYHCGRREASQRTHSCRTLAAVTISSNKSVIPQSIYFQGFHSSCMVLDKSKVEDSLKAKLKSKSDKTVDNVEGAAVDKQHPTPSQSSDKVITKKPLWDRIVAEVKHYYHGFRLLALDMRIASKTLWKNLRGKPVSRRERNQFRRALSDIFRLAPFSVFIIIPFAELALPIAVKLFPRLLPSTFEDKNAREARLRQELSVKLQMAKFMQDTVEEIAMRSKKSSKRNKATEDFAKFFDKIRKSDEDPTNEDILKHAKLFENELTLDNMTRPQLVALCRLIQVPAVGSNNLLRFLLQMKLKRLHDDDTMIQKEGINSLTVQELQTACQARGMRALGMSEQRLKQQLEQWIDLHLNHDVPSSLLLLSRVLFMPENVPVEKMVKEAISVLPEKVADEAEVRAAEIHCERIDNTKRYKITKQEQLEIAKEEAEEKQKEKDKKAIQKAKVDEQKDTGDSVQEVVSKQKEFQQPEPILDPVEDDVMKNITNAEEIRDEGPILTDKAPILKEEITREEIDALDKAIGNIAKEKDESLGKAKSELDDLREDLVEYQQDVLDLDINISSEQDEIVTKEKKASLRLQKSIGRFIAKMDKIVAELEQERKINGDNEAGKEMSVSVEDLKTSLRSLGEIPEDKLAGIAHLLDSNKDGSINLEEAMAAVEVLDGEDVSVTADQLDQLLRLFERKGKKEAEA